MMQETLLRVFIVALGLLLGPRDDPGVEQWDDAVTQAVQEHEEREEEKLDQEMAPVSNEMTNTDNKGPQDDIKNISREQNQSDHRVIEQERLPDLDVTVTNEDLEADSDDDKLPGGHFTAKLDPSLPQKHDSDPETTPKTHSQITPEQQGEDDHTDGVFRDPGKPPGRHDEPEQKEAFSSKEQEPPLSHGHTETSENETSEEAAAEWERDYLWYIWNIFSAISTIRFFLKYLRRNSPMTQVSRAVLLTVAGAPLPDVDTLQHFYTKCVEVSSEKKWREEFLEGFVNDLLDAMKAVCDKRGGMVIEDFQMVNGCDIIVPFTPPEQYSLEFLLSNHQTSDLLSNMQIGGQIKLAENIPNGCACQSSDADDMVCLLHCESETIKIADGCDGLLCLKGTSFLSKSQVTRWFQSTVKHAWAMISHKYEFELNSRYVDAPSALVIRFRSGKKINFSLNPVVKFNTDAHFIIKPWSSNESDSFWTLSLSLYVDRLLDCLSKRLPENSCHIQTLEIACFLHKRQTTLTGSSALKEFHYKTALMHLLLSKDPSQWKPDNVADRLRDLLAFIERSLETKLLNHVLIGNPSVEVIELPARFTKAKPVNLFHPLVVHNCIYINAVKHFQEVLQNAHTLIHDYVAKRADSSNCSIRVP
ncbi:inositol 1,4,5-trisphosphate receptor-interacting protein [Embiotoca jacksoni]|uniref:inositol 1,4,5-trisphosphate receptor-interacting protein n=1 Tax=Embiotoca jacksoni TaxID=100190 RepID=UPI003703917D